MKGYYRTTFDDMLNARHDIKTFLYVPNGKGILALLEFYNAAVKRKWEETHAPLADDDPAVRKAIADYPAMGE